MFKTAFAGTMTTALAATMLALVMPEDTGVTALTAGHVSLSLSPRAAELMELPFVGCQECNNDCPGTVQHEANHAFDGQWQPDGGHTPMNHGCLGKNGQGRCDDPGNHTENCLVWQEDDLAAALDAVLSSDPARITALASQPDGRVQLNPERSAIQIWGCGDRLVAHLPVVLLGE